MALWDVLPTDADLARLREVPPVFTDQSALIDFTRHNLDSYWRGLLDQIDSMGLDQLGAEEKSAAWVALGAPRRHHVLRRGSLTSKSGAGRYVLEALDPRWHRIAREGLRIRERPDTPSLYDDPVDRGIDARDLLHWVVEDGRDTADQTG